MENVLKKNGFKRVKIDDYIAGTNDPYIVAFWHKNKLVESLYYKRYGGNTNMDKYSRQDRVVELNNGEFGRVYDDMNEGFVFDILIDTEDKLNAYMLLFDNYL